MTFTGSTVCSGIGAAEQAMPWVNWQWCAEIEAFPSQVLAQRFGNPNLGDITAADFLDRAAAFGPIDVMAAGTPCQAFSVAGLRGSMDDDRGNLTLRFVEIVNAIDPRIVMWENVPGVLSTSDNAFGCFLGALVGHPTAITFPARHPRWREGSEGRYFAWPNSGVVAGPLRSACWRVQDAQHFGVPQRRERVWLVASPRTSGIDPREILLEPAGMRRHLEASREARQEVAGTVAARTRGGGGFGTDFEVAGGLQPVCLPILEAGARTGKSTTDPRAGIGVGNEGDPMYTLQSGKQHAIAFSCKDHGADASPVSPTLRSMGHDDSHANGGGQVAIAFRASGQEGFTPAKISPPITSTDGGGAGVPTVCYRTAGDGAAYEHRDRTGALNTQTDPSTNLLITHALRGEGFDASEDGTGRGTPLVSMCLNAKGGSGRIDAESETFIAEQWRVRRLLPVECERLQNMPDGWTAISIKGKEAADGPRYKAIGNSWCLANARWVGDRIRIALEAAGLTYRNDADESPRVSYHDARDVERVSEQIRQTGLDVVVMQDGDQWDPATGAVQAGRKE